MRGSAIIRAVDRRMARPGGLRNRAGGFVARGGAKIRGERELSGGAKITPENESPVPVDWGGAAFFANAEERDNRLRRHWIRFLAVDAEIGDGLLYHFFLNFSIEEKFIQRGKGDEARVHFKEIAQRGAAVTAAEPVGAERRDSAGKPGAEH